MLLLNILGIVVLDWLQHACSVQGVYECSLVGLKVSLDLPLQLASYFISYDNHLVISLFRTFLTQTSFDGFCYTRMNTATQATVTRHSDD